MSRRLRTRAHSERRAANELLAHLADLGALKNYNAAGQYVPRYGVCVYMHASAGTMVQLYSSTYSSSQY